jgi:uncharacterized membrane protein YfcA
VFFASLSSIIQARNESKIPYKQILTASIFAIVSAHLCNELVVNQAWFSMRVFRIIVLISIITIALRLIFNQKDELKREEKFYDMPVVGLCGGFIAALSGLGGGVVMVPLMLLLGIFKIKEAKNISSGIIVISSISIVIDYIFEPKLPIQMLSWGKIIPEICLPMVIGTVIGGPLGVMIAGKLESKTLLKSYLYLLILLMCYYFYKIISSN